MEEDEGVPQLWERISSKGAFLPLIFVLGILASIFEPVFRLLSGKGISDAIWPNAYRTLLWTMGLRSDIFSFTLSMSILLLLTFLVLQRQLKGIENPRWAFFLLDFYSVISVSFLLLTPITCGERFSFFQHYMASFCSLYF